jgi:RNA polymerase subunit RPABC4/transcription elongation factor Spt4
VVKEQVENERILAKAVVELHSTNDKGEPSSFNETFGQLFLTNQGLVFIKAKRGFRNPDFTTKINESLKTIAGSFFLPINEIEATCAVKKRVITQKSTFLEVKYKNGRINYFLVRERQPEKVTFSFCNMINSMITKAKAPSSSSVSPPLRLEQPVEMPKMTVEPSAGAPSDMGFLFCPNCGKRLPIAQKFCPFCGFNLVMGASTSSPIANSTGAQSQPVAALKVDPTQPPHWLSHTPVIDCIVIMLGHHKIETKFRTGHHNGFYNVKIVEDDFALNPDSILPEIAEAAKKWDETTVINWIAPYIPRSIEKAKLNPQSGIT